MAHVPGGFAGRTRRVSPVDIRFMATHPTHASDGGRPRKTGGDAVFPRNVRLLLKVAVYGVCGGASAVAFQLGIETLFRHTFLAYARHPLPFFLAASFATVAGSALVSGCLTHFLCPAAAGGGIPQLKAAYWKNRGAVPWRVAWVKFLAGVASVGGGLSLGCEGPCVQISGTVGSVLAKFDPEGGPGARRLGTATAAGAGLAGAFNTPLAAVTFVLEEIQEDLNSRLFGKILLAAVLGAWVTQLVLGDKPSFVLGPVEASTFTVYLLIPVVAAAAALAGVLFQYGALRVRSTFGAGGMLRPIPPWLRPMLGALATWVLGVFVYAVTGSVGVFGLGYGDLSAALVGKLALPTALFLLAAKLVATIVCVGAGGAGGVFSPSLVFGGMCGAIAGGLAGQFLDLPEAEQILLVVVGMSACLGAVIRAPVTAILIVFEMTRDFKLVPALMIATLASQILARRLAPVAFYDAILQQDGIDIERLRPPRDLSDWLQWPVATIASPSPVCVESLDPTSLGWLLASSGHRRFPVVADGKIQGILHRAEIEEAVAQGRPPDVRPAAVCPASTSLREAGHLLMEAPHDALLVVDPSTGALLGIATGHDMLRTEMDMAAEDAS
jgi:CIC family chloride channel protein